MSGGLSFDAATAGYEADPQAKLCNEMCIHAFKCLHDAFPDSMNNMFEIGSGTGGTTSFVLPSFNPHTSKYVFSDLSQTFLTNARKRFAVAFPFVEYTIFNGDKHPGEQGFQSHEYHQILSTNCIHATQHLASTMATCQILLGPRGHIIFNEVQNPGTLAEDLTYGLTDGWWCMSDTERRVTYPLMRIPEWFQLFTSCHYTNVWNTPDEGVIFNQQSILVSRVSDEKIVDTYQGVPQSPMLDPTASYLITGAVGGLGLVSAMLMIETGAKNLHFVSRRDRVPVEAMEWYERIASSTTTIKRQRCNMSSALEVSKLFVDSNTSPPTFGYIQGAGVLSDGTIMKQTRQKYVEVFGPKAFGGWSLHRFSSNKLHENQMAVMFSSGAGFFGSPGQNNHSAANIVIEQNANMRCSMGIASGSIAWGAVSEIGYAARHDIAKGDSAVSFDHAWNCIEAIQSDPTSIVGIMPNGWGMGMGALPMKAIVYSGCAARFRKVGGMMLQRSGADAPRSSAGVGIFQSTTDNKALPDEAPAFEDPAALEYRVVFATVLQLHTQWSQAPLPHMASKDQKAAGPGISLEMGAAEVC